MAIKTEVRSALGEFDAAALAEKLGQIVSKPGKLSRPVAAKEPVATKAPGFVDASGARVAAKKFNSSDSVRHHGLFGAAVAQKAPVAPAARHAAPSSAQRKVAAQLMKLAESNPTRAASILGKMFQSAELGRDVRGQFVTTEDETVNA